MSPRDYYAGGSQLTMTASSSKALTSTLVVGGPMLETRSRVHTRESAMSYVVEALEAKGSASRRDFDVDAILAVSHAVADGWDFTVIEDAIFWRIAARFMLD
jgi:hypothetical protein